MQRRPLLMAAGLAPLLSSTSTRAQAGDIVLGHTGVLSGPLGAVIKAMLAGADLAFGEANAQGGVGGRRVRVVSLDDELKPDKAVANYEKLLNEHKAFAFFGCVGSGTTAAAAKVLKESGAPLVGGYAVADSARDKTRGAAYYVRATSGREAEALVQHRTVVDRHEYGTPESEGRGSRQIVMQAGSQRPLDDRRVQPVRASASPGRYGRAPGSAHDE